MINFKIEKSMLLKSMMNNIEFTEEEINIIQKWQSPGNDGISAIVNGKLYNLKGASNSCNTEVDYYIDVLTNACNKGFLNYNLTVKRGVWDIDFLNEDEVIQKGFLSTSLSKPLNRPYTLIINVPKGTHAIYLRDIASNRISGMFEDELLIQRGYKLKVTNFDKENKILHVNLKIDL